MGGQACLLVCVFHVLTAECFQAEFGLHRKLKGIFEFDLDCSSIIPICMKLKLYVIIFFLNGLLYKYVDKLMNMCI
jgi:hypothetical protein